MQIPAHPRSGVTPRAGPDLHQQSPFAPHLSFQQLLCPSLHPSLPSGFSPGPFVTPSLGGHCSSKRKGVPYLLLETHVTGRTGLPCPQDGGYWVPLGSEAQQPPLLFPSAFLGGSKSNNLTEGRSLEELAEAFLGINPTSSAHGGVTVVSWGRRQWWGSRIPLSVPLLPKELRRGCPILSPQPKPCLGTC